MPIKSLLTVQKIMHNTTEDRKKIFILLIVILIPAFVLDQVTKYLAEHYLTDSPKVLIDGVFEFNLYHNTGAVWGSFSGNAIILAFVSVLLVFFVLLYLFRIKYTKRNLPLLLCLIFIVCGAFGNLADRLKNKQVTDFIYFKLINFPIFNVADIYVTCSTIILAILILFYYKDEDFEWMKKEQ